MVTKNKRAFTLVELLISMAILIVLVTVVTMALNPGALMNKANDSKRKSDLNKFKAAFEEYFNDKGYYPSSSDLLDWNVADNCGKKIDKMSKYLGTWLCDPYGRPYMIITNTNWFKVVTNLDNKKDKDIPDGWYTNNQNYSVVFDRDEVNYGVSSPNVLWYEENGVPDFCGTMCQILNADGCNQAPAKGCSAPDVCYLGLCSNPACRVSSCN